MDGFARVFLKNRVCQVRKNLALVYEGPDELLFRACVENSAPERRVGQPDDSPGTAFQRVRQAKHRSDRHKNVLHKNSHQCRH